MTSRRPGPTALVLRPYLGVDSTVATLEVLLTAREPEQNSTYNPEDLLTQMSQSGKQQRVQAGVTKGAPHCKDPQEATFSPQVLH